MLLWLRSSLRTRLVSEGAAHQAGSISRAANLWIIEYYHLMPDDARPASLDRRLLKRFANYFASYLEVSFDLYADVELLESDTGCYCEVCAFARVAPVLRPKRLRMRDKRRAVELIDEVLDGMASGLGVPARRVEQLDGQMARDAALVAYGVDLIGRCRGERVSPASLALWRRITRDRSGGLIPGFEFTVEAVLEAEGRLLSHLGGSPR